MCDFSFVYSLIKSRQNRNSTLNKPKNNNSLTKQNSLTQTLSPNEFKAFRSFQR